MATKRVREHRATVIRELEARARLFTTYATSTPDVTLRCAMLRLIAAQLEVAAILRLKNGENGKPHDGGKAHG